MAHVVKSETPQIRLSQKKRPAAVLSSVNAVNAEKEQLRICYADRNTHTNWKRSTTDYY